ncbi:RNA polymerase sigma factor [Caulobacter segnis]|uniref:RNA polymerase sigma factor n=1 Tax=Caulobacter segnis TaxID=88688 RepID=UPI001CC10D16|nr:sigma-70 family RNA polymerase sigma factor [Caulobacter segnis]UAL10171.1 sigma-70 family RNA polymerase sigma factor [Caulobacter segnis]
MKRPSPKLDLFLENQARLVSFAAPIVGDRGRAEDVVQEAFIRLERDETGEPERPLAYLFRIVRNLALDVARRRVREQEGETDPEWWMLPAAVRTPEEELLQDERLALLQRVLRGLDPAMRQAVEMNRFNGATLAEIAERLGVSVPTAHRLVRAGLARIAQALDDADRDPS